MKAFISSLSLQCRWFGLSRYKELTIHLQLLWITANLSKPWTTTKSKMKDDPELTVLPSATSSPPFREARAKIARESDDSQGRLIVAVVGQDECKCGTGARRRTSQKWLQWLMRMRVVLLTADTMMPWWWTCWRSQFVFTAAKHHCRRQVEARERWLDDQLWGRKESGQQTTANNKQGHKTTTSYESVQQMAIVGAQC